MNHLLPCQFQSQVETAVCTRIWTDGLKQHAQACNSCRQLVRAIEVVQLSAAKMTADAPSSPPPSTIQLRARLVRQQQHQSRLEYVQAIGCLTIFLFVALGCLHWTTYGDRHLLDDMAHSASTCVTGMFSGFPIAAVFGLCVMFWVLAEDLFRTTLAER